MLLAAPGQTAAVGVLHDNGDEVKAFDTRATAVGRSAAQRSAVNRLGAKVTWNRFGTVGSLTKRRGWLATGLSGDAEGAARELLRSNAGLFGLSPAGVDGLELVNDTRLTGSDAHVVLFRQSFGDLPVVGGGLVSVGLSDGKVVHASSSLGRSDALAGEQRLLAQDAWRKAAASVGRSVPADGVRSLGRKGAFGGVASRGICRAMLADRRGRVNRRTSGGAGRRSGR